MNALQRLMLSRVADPTDVQFIRLTGMFGLVDMLATGFLIVMIVHQDPIPGLCQDWLVRPIKRSDLLLSKLLFVALLIQGPIFTVEVCQRLAAGHSLGTSIGTALSRSLWMFVRMDLPCVVLGAVTRNLVEAIGGALMVVVAFFLSVFLSWSIGHMRSAPVAVPSSTEWAQVTWGLVAATVVLTIQYRRRRTGPARWTSGAAVLIWLALQFLPWQSAFGIRTALILRSPTAGPGQIASFTRNMPELSNWSFE